ncbi:hypothetical protein EUX98_g9263 [Antrodiella citrinella]|uniref:LysM domain-containing protein n=1 Tax=Antrodiella citrinella TaxID=2447956 RepID=A0A4S4LVW2_9APHY|nr:hypothetical protein EUX98_g9263 [Antrodiella citrinella]
MQIEITRNRQYGREALCSPFQIFTSSMCLRLVIHIYEKLWPLSSGQADGAHVVMLDQIVCQSWHQYIPVLIWYRFQLAEVNSAVIDPLCDNLFPGETICLGVTGQDCDVVHVVVEGDNCIAIAANASITESLLLTNNPNVNAECSNIGIGEVLCTANVTIPYTSSTAA